LQEVVVKSGQIEIYNDDFEEAIAAACEEFGIDDLKHEGQRPWKAVLQYVGKRVFPDTVVLKSNKRVLYQGNSIPTNNNSYDYELIDALCDYYIMLSNKYNKLISIIAFSYMLNIPTNTIDVWKDTESSTPTFKIWKKLSLNREDCLKDKNFDSSNVVGAISIGNQEYSWNMPGVTREHKRLSLSDSELPKLSGNGANVAIIDTKSNVL
jgi:hypothetical protein